jgi:hypothetical protein
MLSPAIREGDQDDRRGRERGVLIPEGGLCGLNLRRLSDRFMSIPADAIVAIIGQTKKETKAGRCGFRRVRPDTDGAGSGRETVEVEHEIRRHGDERWQVLPEERSDLVRFRAHVAQEAR